MDSKSKFHIPYFKPMTDLRRTLIFCFWAIVNGFLLAKNGMVTTGESEKYIEQARLFVQTGRFSSPNFRLYFTQISLLSLCLEIKMSFIFVVLIQLLFNLLSIFCFYNALLYLFKAKNVAFAGVAILLLNLPYQEFNTFLQTESLFYSFTLIFCCYLLRIEVFSLKKMLTIILSILVIVLTRPTGLLILPPVFIYLFLVFAGNLNGLYKTLILGSCMLLFLYLLNSALGSGGRLDFMLPFRDERIICGVPTLPHFIDIKTAGDGNSIYGLLYYVTHNFSQFSRLVWLRTVAFFGLYRTYYSWPHNLYLILYFYCILLMALLGVFYWTKFQKSRSFFLLSFIFLTWLTVILTCDDWHNRFYLTISPYLILFSMAFLSKFIKKTGDA